MRSVTILGILVIFFCISSAGASEVTLSTPQRDYYFLTGENALIPVTIASTYDHDVTGTLKQVRIPVTVGSAGSGLPGASVQTRPFSAFTEERTVPLPAGTSDTPADYDLTIAFSYPESGGRTVTLGGIRVHFVTSMGKNPPQQETVTGKDIPDAVSAPASAGSAPKETSQAADPSAALSNSQMAQDTAVLRELMAQENNQSADIKAELQGIIMADPLVISRASSLTGAGFTLTTTGIFPVSNRSGTFALTYSAGAQSAVIRGELEEARVLFAEETSNATVPLPDPLSANVTFREYRNRTAEYGFTPALTRINATTGRETVDLTYANSAGREIRFNAQVDDGAVVAAGGEDPEDPLAPFIPVISLAAVLLISAGIWHLARTYRRDIPEPGIPEPVPGQRCCPHDIVSNLLDEAERDADWGSWPEAYRKTGRAVRVFVSHEMGTGDELTGTEAERLVRSHTEDMAGIEKVLGRCRTVGFARQAPDPAELREMIRDTRALLMKRKKDETANRPPEQDS